VPLVVNVEFVMVPLTSDAARRSNIKPFVALLAMGGVINGDMQQRVIVALQENTICLVIRERRGSRERCTLNCVDRQVERTVALG